MSIRLRLTIIYTAILAATLLAFSITLYTIQSRSTMESIKQEIRASSNGLVQSVKRSSPPQLPANPPVGQAAGQATGNNPPPPQPMPFNDFSSDQAFKRLPEREIVRILDKDGNLIASPLGSSDDALPLSAEGLAKLQQQETWWETAVVADRPLLIYSRPVTDNDDKIVAIIQLARPLTERNKSLQSLATILSIAGLVTIAVAFTIGWFLSGFSLQPIQKITRTARSIGEERDFSQRVQHQGPPDEVGLLAVTFNSMLGQLEDAYQKLQHALQMQKNFVADVSHELRTPLTTLRGNLGLLQRRPNIPEEEQDDILTDMVDESDRLIRLVNDLLVLARADAGRRLQKEPVDIPLFLEEIARQTRPLALNRQVTTAIEAEGQILIDKDALKQVLLILTDNAIKHTDADICLHCYSEDEDMFIGVIDSGRGIPAEKLPYLFDRFYRGEAEAGNQGFGLGLAIARSLVEIQGGSIYLDSEIGKGSVVTLRFPIHTGEQGAEEYEITD